MKANPFTAARVRTPKAFTLGASGVLGVPGHEALSVAVEADRDVVRALEIAACHADYVSLKPENKPSS